MAALLLGGSVLLIQVRRNSLEAVRKTTFVSNVSHELKTPLTTIRMYGEMLGDGIVKDETKKKGYLETIISESQRLTRLVNNVLDFGRLERGEKTYNREEIVLGSAVENILETQRLRLESAGLELEWVDDSQGAMAKLDPDALEQVLLNLLDNLVKYAADGKYAGLRLKKQEETVSHGNCRLGPGYSVRAEGTNFRDLSPGGRFPYLQQAGLRDRTGDRQEIGRGHGGSNHLRSQQAQGGQVPNRISTIKLR